MKTLHRIGGLTFTDNRLAIEIDGEEKQYDLRSVSDALANASEPESPVGWAKY
ncbi:MAG: hypothetical protein WBM35_04275 [Candidatus Electrothrix sp.]